MAEVAEPGDIPRQYTKKEVEEMRRKLEEGCRRLQDIMQKREEEMKRWEDDMLKFLKEETARLTAQRLADQNRLFEQARARAGVGGKPSVVAEAWSHYEQQWDDLQYVESGLTFRSIPWPMPNIISIPELLLPHSISQFILSPEHSPSEPRKRRIYSALRRWHTDHFDVKVLQKVVEEDRPAVQEGVGRVVRCLNDMLAAEG